MPYRQLVRKAVEEGFWVAALWDPTLETPEYLDDVRAAADVMVLADFADGPGLRRTIRETAERFGVATIYHVGREETMLAAYEVAELLGAELNPATAVRLLTDKLAMRRHLADCGISAVRFAAAATRADVPAALAEVGLPAVVKPTALAGSRGVFLWRRAEDGAAWTELVDGFGCAGPFLVEEYLRGPEFSVETLSHHGRHQVVGVTEKQLGPPPLFVEVGHVHPARLPPDRRRAVEDLTTSFLTACGYRFGPAHTEVIWTADGPRIVESQARLGGDRIPRLVQLSCGLDIERAVFAALAGRLPARATHTATAEVRFVTLPPGRVDAVRGLQAARRLGGVDELTLRPRPGDVLTPVRDSRGRHGHVIVSGAGPEEATARLDEVLATIAVVVNGVAHRLDGRPHRTVGCRPARLRTVTEAPEGIDHVVPAAPACR
ncbi:ATP-grasp domain-containing protein [Geodermatophilus sp. CPCC 205506]|uniref:ATP-grasp domain-containing protein n=1 Tax=Geodermatophilus sp. CPCC 205506 TaxID=2936596 RepID=UPI003EEF3502